MSDDIDRLKTVLENLAQLNDTMKDNNEVMSDVVNACMPVELETDPEGHAALFNLAVDIRLAWSQLNQHVENANALVWKLRVKARDK